MARSDFPLSISAKQKALYSSPLPPAELVALGDAYAERGLWHDALDFYEVSRDGGRLAKVAGEAVADADLVLYLNARRAAGQAPDAADLRAIRERAVASGKEATAGRVDLLVVPAEG